MSYVRIYVRHSAECKHRKNSSWKQCGCPKHLHWHRQGKLFRQSAKTRSWSAAEQKARALEAKFLREETGGQPIVSAKTLVQAVADYLEDKHSQQLSSETLAKHELTFLKQLVPWCLERGIHLLRDLTLPKLQEWRSSWDIAPLTARKKQERVRSFMRFCLDNGWIVTNPARGLSRIKVDPKPTDYFPKQEYAKLLKVASVHDQTTSALVPAREQSVQAQRLRALLELMRWSGLAIGDAATLERDRLTAKNTLFLYRAKTGVPVFLPLPRDVANTLRRVPAGAKSNPRYFFWSGNGARKSTVGDWQRAFRKLFRLADIRHSDGRRKRCHPHMLRDTFAVESLLAGMPLEQVSVYLGHSSVTITEKHYAPFVKARQQQLVRNMRRALAKQGKH